LELGRTLLVAGAVRRRMRQKKGARDLLQRALTTFDGLGAPLWCERAQRELARIGGRAPTSTGLTPTEAQIASHVAEGKTNREVAEALFVSVHTVEANLTRIYRKLDVRSRTELARKLKRRDTRDSSPHAAL
jgi:DNA-binding CsgD family transcriptional regulator